MHENLSPYRENAATNKLPEIEVGAAKLCLFLKYGSVFNIDLVAEWVPKYKYIGHNGMWCETEYDTIGDIKEVVRSYIRKIIHDGFVCIASSSPDKVDKEKFILLSSISSMEATYSKITVGPSEPKSLLPGYKFVSFIF